MPTPGRLRASPVPTVPRPQNSSARVLLLPSHHQAAPWPSGQLPKCPRRPLPPSGSGATASSHPPALSSSPREESAPQTLTSECPEGRGVSTAPGSRAAPGTAGHEGTLQAAAGLWERGRSPRGAARDPRAGGGQPSQVGRACGQPVAQVETAPPG